MGEAKSRRNSRDCCENCAFWEKYERVNGSGECHAGPPFAIPVGMAPSALQGQPPNAICQGIWPSTHAGRWCGAHRRSLMGNSMEIDLSNFAPIGDDKPQ